MKTLYAGSPVRRSILLLLWLASDLALFVMAYVSAYVMRVGFILSTEFPIDRFILAACVAAPLWLSVLVMSRVFALTRNQCALRNLAHITYASIVGTAAFALAYYFLFGLFFSRALVVLAFASTTLLTYVWHCFFERIERLLLRSFPPTFPTLIVGLTRESASLIHTLEERRSPLTPVAILDGRGSKESHIHGVPMLGKLHKLEEVIAAKGITHLIQCSDLEHSINLLSLCRARGITYLLLPSVLGIVGGDERVESLEGFSVTVVRPKQTIWTLSFA